MTTIAYRDGIMAADTAFVDGAGCSYAQARKIHRCPDGTLLGGAGDASVIQRARRWWDEGCREDAKPKLYEGDDSNVWISMLIVRPDGSVSYAERDLVEIPVDGDFFAVGHGKETALGAMAAGASATQAVEIAARFDIATKLPVMVERLNP